MASTGSFVPTRESDLVDFLNNFSTRAAAEAAAIGLSVSQCTAFQTLVTAFVTAWNVTRSRSILGAWQAKTEAQRFTVVGTAFP